MACVAYHVPCNKKAIAEVTKTPDKLSDTLFSKFLISFEEKEEFQEYSLENTEKARRLVACLEDEIKYSPEERENILEILREHSYNDFADYLTDTKEEIELIEIGDNLSNTLSWTSTTISANSELDDENLNVKIKCGCKKCSIEDFMQGKDCPNKKTPKLILTEQTKIKKRTGKVQKTMPCSKAKLLLKTLAGEVASKYLSLISSTVKELRKMYPLLEIITKLRSIITPKGTKHSIHTRIYDEDPRIRLRDVKTDDQLETYLSEELCCWFNIKAIENMRNFLPHDRDDSILVEYKQLQAKYIARGCFRYIFNNHSEIVCKLHVPTDLRKVKHKQIDYLKHKIEKLVLLPDVCNHQVDDENGDLVIREVNTSHTRDALVTNGEREDQTPILTNMFYREFETDPQAMMIRIPRSNRFSLNQNDFIRTKQKVWRKDRKFICIWLFISTLFFTLLFAHSTSITYYLLTNENTLNFHGQDTVQLLTTYNTVKIRFKNSNASEVEIYAGASVYSEPFFKQGTIPAQANELINMQYLLPHSTLTVQIQSDRLSVSDCTTSLTTGRRNITEVSNELFSRVCITNETSTLFNHAAYYSFWIETSIPLNYTITGEVYRYNVSDANLVCSLPEDEDICVLTNFENSPTLYGVSRSPHNTSNTLKYRKITRLDIFSSILLLTLPLLFIICIAIATKHIFKLRATCMHNCFA